MSFETALGGLAINRRSTSELLEAIRQQNELTRQLLRNQPKYVNLLKSNNDNLSSNVADGVVILLGRVIPAGKTAVLEDVNLSFTTVAGTVRLVTMNAKGTTILNDILRDINSTSNGLARGVIEENERLAVVGQSAGAGTFGIHCSGFLTTGSR